jgi:uncharacterized protein
VSALIIWAVRIVVVLLLIRIVLRFLSRAAGAGRTAAGSAPRKKAERIGGALVRDPQCGTYVTRERAVTLGTGDATQFFCSTQCRDAFRQVKASA